MGRDHDRPDLAAAAKDGVVEGVTMTSDSAHEWLGGLDGKLVDRLVDSDSHNLHTAAGQLCPKCRQLIEPGQAVRKTVSGTYKHDAC